MGSGGLTGFFPSTGALPSGGSPVFFGAAPDPGGGFTPKGLFKTGDLRYNDSILYPGRLISVLLHDMNPFLRYAQQFRYDRSGTVRCPADARLLYVKAGRGTLFTEDGQDPIGPGTLVLIGAGFVYRMELDEPLELMTLNFDYTFERSGIKMVLGPCPPEMAGQLRQEPFEDCPALSSPLVLQGMFQMQSALEKLILVFQTRKLYYEEECSCLLKSLLIQLARSTLLRRDRIDRIADRLIGYIQEHYREDLTGERLASELNYHACHLNRIMRSATGTTVHRYLIGYRITVSKDMLCNTGMSIDEIAAEAGFKNTSYFSSSFRKIVGCSPSSFRSRHLQII